MESFLYPLQRHLALPELNDSQKAILIVWGLYHSQKDCVKFESNLLTDPEKYLHEITQECWIFHRNKTYEDKVTEIMDLQKASGIDLFFYSPRADIIERVLHASHLHGGNHVFAAILRRLREDVSTSTLTFRNAKAKLEYLQRVHGWSPGKRNKAYWLHYI